MHRFYLPPADCQGPSLSLIGREAHHALHVLRLRRGERVHVLDGAGKTLVCEVAETGPGRDRLVLNVLERQATPPLPFQITLAQAIPKGKLFEAIIQKATELGVYQIIPLITQRVVGKMDSKDAQQKADKWRIVAVEAIKQCGSAWLPRVEPPMSINEFVEQMRRIELPLVGSLASEAYHPRRFFESFAQTHGRKPKSISFAIGPEGDFTPDELSCLQTAGALPINLGRLVLRTETAAIYCLSIANYELQADSSG